VNDLRIEKVRVKDLILDPTNARKHSPKNLEAIKGSLARFGQQKPIVVDANNVVLAGNGTLTAARELGWEELTVARTSLRGTDAQAFALADNRTAELASWDIPVLSELTAALQDDGVDLGAIGFDNDFLNSIKLPEDDPWGADGPPAEPAVGDSMEGQVSRILLVYQPEEYERVIAMAQEAMEKLELRDMSQLFVAILKRETFGVQE
jgi:hypothetical protein